MSEMSNFQKTKFFNDSLSKDQRDAVLCFDEVVREYQICSQSGPEKEFHDFIDHLYEHRNTLNTLTNQEMHMIGSALHYDEKIIDYIVDTLFMFEVFENHKYQLNVLKLYGVNNKDEI